jgi:endonuclease YncB( thermonuclease family)
VIDGDTIEIQGRRIRFDGIDAPESSQLCVRGGAKERCGQAAAFFLSNMIGRQTVRCETHDVDRYGRDIATCWLGDRNLNEAMVAAGQALAYRRYSRACVGVEDAARAAGIACGRRSSRCRGTTAGSTAKRRFAAIGRRDSARQMVLN